MFNKQLEYKNHLEEWYEEDFRNQKISLINKVKDSLRINASSKIKKSVNIFLLIGYIIGIFILFIKFDSIKQRLGDTSIKLVEFFGYIILPLCLWIYPGISRWITELAYKILNRKEI